MFNLLVSQIGWTPPTGRVDKSRFLTQTTEQIKQQIFIGDTPNKNILTSIQTVFMPEIGSNEAPPEARIGKVTDLHDLGREYEFNFYYDQELAPIPTEVINELSSIFGVDGFGLSNTHWSVKHHDIFELLYKYKNGAEETQGVFRVSRRPVKQRQIAVMMPFDHIFTEVFKAINILGMSIGCSCVRADGIWNEDAIIQDIVNLIIESKVVLCDVSGRNPNVFYEAGIAHAMGKSVVLITQNEQDVPFDLRHLRYVQYLPNNQGYMALQNSLRERLIYLFNG